MAKRTIISLILTFSYAVGFAHNLIPHHSDVHEFGNHAEVAHNHAHHVHDDLNSLEEGHSHVVHGDHFDEGLLDYLICLFEGVHHHHSCDAQCTPQNSSFKYSTEKSTQGDQLSTAELSIPSLEIQSGAISTTTKLDLTQIDLNSSSGRAPPYTYL